MSLCTLNILFPPNDQNDVRFIVAFFLREDYSGSKLITDFSDLGPAPSNQESMVLWFASHLNSVVVFSMFVCNVH